MKSTRLTLLVPIILVHLFFSCENDQKEKMSLSIENKTTSHLDITYEIFVQSFADSNGDGIGDIPGMTNKLDYLADLGIEAIWLMPISKSPSYHKYDVVDYKSIHPDYGTMDDFRNFISEAHKRGIKVVIDFIINHTSNKHPWFIESKKREDNAYKDYYIWSDEQEVKDEIAKRETSHDSDNITQWHKADGTDQLYYGFFSGAMPDLNYDNPKVFDEIVEIGKYWLSDIGVDGLRMDAAKHIFPDHRAEDNHRFWEKFRVAMEAIKPDVYIVGEVWADANTTAPFANGLSSLFNFDLASSILHTLNNGVLSAASIDGTGHKVTKDSSFIKVLNQNMEIFNGRNSKFVDGIFLSNHDQNRAASELKNDKSKIKQAAAILFTLPGRPYIYYGEELGMLGIKPDEHIREPFLWGNNGELDNVAKWIEPKYSTFDSIKSMATQSKNDSSILNIYKKLIEVRKNSGALREGDLVEVDFSNSKTLGFTRNLESESVLAIHNIGRSKSIISLPKGFENYNKVLFSRGATQNKGVITLSKNGSLLLTND